MSSKRFGPMILHRDGDYTIIDSEVSCNCHPETCCHNHEEVIVNYKDKCLDVSWDYMSAMNVIKKHKIEKNND